MKKLELRKEANVELGTVSHGTHRYSDLISAFEQEIKRLVTMESFYALRNERKQWKCCGKFWKSDYVGFLFELMDSLAPEGCYFGATEGDGSDYGFWKESDYEEEC